MQLEGVSRSHIFAFVHQNSCWLIFILYVKKIQLISCLCFHVFKKKSIKKRAMYNNEIYL